MINFTHFNNLLRQWMVAALLVAALGLCQSCAVRMNDHVFDPMVPLSISPKTSRIPARTGGIFFVTRGGTPPYQYRIKEGHGRIDNQGGYYEASNQSEAVTVEVLDQKGAIDEALVEVIEINKITQE